MQAIEFESIVQDRVIPLPQPQKLLTIGGAPHLFPVFHNNRNSGAVLNKD